MTILQPSDSLSPDQVDRGLRAVVRDGVASQIMGSLTTGPFLVAFALALGASNAVVGVMAAIPPLMQTLQLPSVFLVERVANRRLLAVAGSSLSRLMLLAIAVIPFVTSGSSALPLLLAVLMLHSGFSAVSTCGWNSWMRDLVPEDRFGAFFSRRLAIATAVGIVVSLAASAWLDYAAGSRQAPELWAYSLLFAAGSIAGLGGAYFISTIPEPRMHVAHVPLADRFLRPLRDGNFRNLVYFLAPWNFGVNLAAPFFTVYMIQRLELPMALIIGLTLLSQLVNVAFLQLWGRFADRFSNKSVLRVSGPLFLSAVVAWTFTTLPDQYFLTIPLLVAIHVVMGIAMAGVAVASGNIGLKLAPRGQATAYLATLTLANSLAAGLAPILGGLLADFYAARELALTVRWTSPVREITLQTLDLQHWDFFFLFASLIGLYALHRLSKVNEEGEVEEGIVVRELFGEVRRGMGNLSTIGGLRQLVQLSAFLSDSPTETSATPPPGTSDSATERT